MFALRQTRHSLKISGIYVQNDEKIAVRKTNKVGNNLQHSTYVTTEFLLYICLRKDKTINVRYADILYAYQIQYVFVIRL